MQTVIDSLNLNSRFSYNIGEKLVYKTTLTGLETVYKKGEIDKILHDSYYQLESGEMIHQSQVITVL